MAAVLGKTTTSVLCRARNSRAVAPVTARLGASSGAPRAPSVRDGASYYRRSASGKSTDGGSLASVDGASKEGRANILGVHHVALICRNLENSLEFYQGILGLQINPDRPHNKLPYRGAWLWIGPEMIHLMELPNPDPASGRPEHGGRDRHFCIGVENIEAMVKKLEAADIPFTRSMSGRPAIFFRDPDANTLEVVELEPWR